MHARLPEPLMLVLFCNPENAALVWFVATVSYVELSFVFSWELGRLIINICGH